jgi:hypothetical protein
MSAKWSFNETERGHLLGMREQQVATKNTLGHLGGSIDEGCDARIELIDRLLSDAMIVSDRAFLRRITVQTKHGPRSGGPGDCRPDCVKCEAAQRLKNSD